MGKFVCGHAQQDSASLLSTSVNGIVFSMGLSFLDIFGVLMIFIGIFVCVSDTPWPIIDRLCAECVKRQDPGFQRRVAPVTITAEAENQTDPEDLGGVRPSPDLAESESGDETVTASSLPDLVPDDMPEDIPQRE